MTNRNERSVIHLSKRKGTQEDPYLDITEVLTVQYGKVFLKELPSKQFRVTILDQYNSYMTEVFTNDRKKIQSGTYYVDYTEGIVYFNPDAIGKVKILTYKGTGIIMYPASRIFVDSKDGENVINTLQNIVDIRSDLRPVGEYLSQNSYSTGNIVNYDGRTYMAKRASLNVVPTNEDYWQMMSERGYQGIQGERGEKGAKGDKGDKGEKGDQGIQGERGLVGAQGIQGERGYTGAKGDKGEQGDQGIQGVKGDKGDVGLQGIQGIQGERGLVGAKGDKGDTGAKGDRGLQGEQGIQGIQGVKGDKGDKGDQGIQGVKGDVGQAAIQYYTWVRYADSPTAGITSNPTGKPYMGVATQKTSPTPSVNYADYTWSLIKGEQGIQGVKGDRGAVGERGVQGEQGIQGVKGDKGDQGIQGVKGDVGAKGDKGDKGDQGIQGIQGVKGDTGTVSNDWKNTYSATTSYPKGSLVHYEGSVYLSTQSTTKGNLPTNTSYWNLFVEKGLNATNGVNSVNGKTGIITLIPSDIGSPTTSQLTGHTSDSSIHVTSAEKNAWNAKETTAGSQAKANTAETNAKNYTDSKITDLVGSSPQTLDTLNELASALGNDPNFATTISTQIGNKANSSDLTTHSNDAVKHITASERTTWNAKASTAVATTSANGLMSSTDKIKIDGVAANANNYVHPTTHPASMIVESSTKRFVTDVEKTTWSGKANNVEATPSVGGLMSSGDKAKLDGIETGATKYIHPESHPASMITESSTKRFVSDVEKVTWDGKTTGAEVDAKLSAHKTDVAPLQYGNRFEWRFNPHTDSLDLVVLKNV